MCVLCVCISSFSMYIYLLSDCSILFYFILFYFQGGRGEYVWCLVIYIYIYIIYILYIYIFYIYIYILYIYNIFYYIGNFLGLFLLININIQYFTCVGLILI